MRSKTGEIFPGFGIATFHQAKFTGATAFCHQTQMSATRDFFQPLALFSFADGC
jgi:hypothetical protein